MLTWRWVVAKKVAHATADSRKLLGSCTKGRNGDLSSSPNTDAPTWSRSLLQPPSYLLHFRHQITGPQPITGCTYAGGAAGQAQKHPPSPTASCSSKANCLGWDSQDSELCVSAVLCDM